MSKRAASAADSAVKRVKVETGASSVVASVNPNRVRTLFEPPAPPPAGGSVVYWMSRDQRCLDNWALLYAREEAVSRGASLSVVFNLVDNFPSANLRHYAFMIKGLAELEADLKLLEIPFFLLRGDPAETVPRFAERNLCSLLVMDFSPMRIGRIWRTQLAASVQAMEQPCSLAEVDAHNVVPCWLASPKKEYGARTIRSKINKLLPEYLVGFPPLGANPSRWPSELEQPSQSTDWDAILAKLPIDRSVPEVSWCKPGAAAAAANLEDFLTSRLRLFESKRNDPTVAALSNVSPWLHYGQISAQRCALAAKQHSKSHGSSVASFVEELVVRRELADNFCYYDDGYDHLYLNKYDWCRETLQKHASDPRTVSYSREQMESFQTHDRLWNAAQAEMVNSGKMHGFLRMYWAKKILEWTPAPGVDGAPESAGTDAHGFEDDAPQRALATAIYLNDKYSLDGRDPNGYVGCQWAIGGLHDQGWQERPIFGKIRFMNFKGCQKKFDVEAYIHDQLSTGSQTPMAYAAPGGVAKTIKASAAGAGAGTKGKKGSALKKPKKKQASFAEVQAAARAKAAAHSQSKPKKAAKVADLF